MSLNKLPQEVRDDCRADRTISRASLITIAKKKQARGMTTAYNALKAKQEKGKTARTKKNPNEPNALIALIDKAITKLQSIDTTGWTEEDKTSFKTSLTTLKNAIDAHLVPPPA